MTFVDGIPLALSLSGAAMFLFIMAATGRVATPREIKEKNETIEWQRKRIDELARQVDILTHSYGSTTNEFLADIVKMAHEEQTRRTSSGVNPTPKRRGELE